jgi:integrase/recombinase XerD
LRVNGAQWLQVKVNRYERAKILTQSEIQQIFGHGLTNDRDRALFAVCLFNACRIREAVTLQTTDIYTSNGKVKPQLIIRKANTKGKLATRAIPVIEDLRQILSNYYPQVGGDVGKYQLDDIDNTQPQTNQPETRQI